MGPLIPSSADKRAFTKEVWARFEKVIDMMHKRRGIVVIPSDIESAMQRARPIAIRHRRGDFRHSEVEMQFEQVLARWLVQTWAELNGHPVTQPQFGPHN
jgi:hypothetical protein